MSLARRHFEKVRAQREAAVRAPAGTGETAPAATSATTTMSDRMLMTLRGHKAALKGIQSRKLKTEFKRDHLGDYDAYVDGVLAAGNGAQDTVLMTVMLWRIDAGLYADAMEIAAYALRHGLAMPDDWKRNVPTTLLEELAEAADGTATPELRTALETALDLTEGEDLPDEVRAKALKALGMLVKDSEPARAITLFETALDLDKSCGVKTELNRLKKAAGTEQASSSGDDAAG